MRGKTGIKTFSLYKDFRLNFLILGFATVFTKNISAQITFPCSGMEFQCGNDLCIRRHRICDGTPDCPNGTDEADCLLIEECFGIGFKCDNGKCISSEWTCDGINDCMINKDGDISDEKLCSSYTSQFVSRCPPGHWMCANGKCISRSYFCDNDQDCGDRSDEPLGCIKNPCEGNFKCKSGECILLNLKCDGVINCNDGSDENDCLPILGQHECSILENRTLCKSGTTCINISDVCDKTVDCPDRSDELFGCVKPCSTSHCAQKCRITTDLTHPGTCHCSPGYRISARDKNNCDDLDECLEFGKCSQTCINLPGTFECACNAGFQLLSDNRSCELLENKQSLILALRNGIKILSVDHQEGVPVVETLGLPVSVTYNARADYVYWTDTTEMKEGIWRSRLDGSELEAVVNSGVVLPNGIAYDWIGDNFYFLNSYHSQIVICSVGLELCSILLEDKEMYTPVDLALNPNQGFLFWSNWPSAIYRSGMDGSNPVIIASNIQQVNGIALDHGNGRVYWTDAIKESIETVKYDGSDKRTIHSGSEKITHPFSVVVFGDFVFWSDWNMHEIQACNKFDGSNFTTIAKEKSEKLLGFTIFHEANQPITRNSCEGIGCSHICVPRPDQSFRCVCPVGMQLDSNGLNCTDDPTKPKLLVVYNNTLKTMRLNSIGRDVFDQFQLDDIGNIGALVYNPINDTIILSDLESKKIYEFDEKSNSLTVLVQDDVESVQGMDIDVVGENLYWIDSVKKTVEVMSLRTSARVVLFKEIGRPVDIIIVPEMKFMFLATIPSQGGFNIVRLSTNGFKRNVIIQRSSGEPVGLNYHRPTEHILWTDAKSNSIESISTDGQIHLSFGSNVSAPFGITSYKNRIYWTESSQNLLHSQTMESELQDRPVFFGQYSQNISNSVVSISTTSNLLAKVTVIQKNLEFATDLMNKHQCSFKSNRRALCSHICLMSDAGFRGDCVCPRGFRLGTNGQTCKVDNSNRTEIPIGCVDGKCQQFTTNIPLTSTVNYVDTLTAIGKSSTHAKFPTKPTNLPTSSTSATKSQYSSTQYDDDVTFESVEKISLTTKPNEKLGDHQDILVTVSNRVNREDWNSAQPQNKPAASQTIDSGWIVMIIVNLLGLIGLMALGIWVVIILRSRPGIRQDSMALFDLQ